MSGLVALGLPALGLLAAAVAVTWSGMTVLRMAAARQLGDAPSWWRCALLLDQPGPAPTAEADHAQEVDAA